MHYIRYQAGIEETIIMCFDLIRPGSHFFGKWRTNRGYFSSCFRFAGSLDCYRYKQLEQADKRSYYGYEKVIRTLQHFETLETYKTAKINPTSDLPQKATPSPRLLFISLRIDPTIYFFSSNFAYPHIHLISAGAKVDATDMPPKR
jgi:hypothetical protein